MNTTDLIQPTHFYNYGNVTVQVFHAQKGKGLPAHEHNFAHTTQCHAGRISVTKQSGTWVLDKSTKPLLLKANEWHEIEALDDETVFENILINTTGVNNV
jgi:quercetin dioxygenase-like cupin family protein